MFDLALIIPSYNEEARIGKTFEAYFKYFLSSRLFDGKKVVLVFVNDGSLDSTAQVMNRFECISNDRVTVKVISYTENRGKGGAIKAGCASEDALYYGFVDADLAFSPELIEPALKLLETNDLVIGRRNHDVGRSLYSKFRDGMSGLLRNIVNSMLGMPKNLDTQCGFKFFNHNVAKNILVNVEQQRFSFDLELIMRARQQNLKIISLPVNFQHTGVSSVTWRDGFRYILDTISISEKLAPINIKKFFLKLFLLSSVITLIIYGWVIFQGYLFSDDFTWLWHGQKINNSIQNILTFRMSSFYSPVLNAFYSVYYSVFGYNSVLLFLTGTIVHILVSFLSGVFVWQLSRSKLISFVAVLLTAFAGGAFEPLVWIGANMHSIVTLFILSSLICYYQFLKSHQSKYLIFSLLFFILGLGTKESAIVTPALMILVTIYFKLLEKKDVYSKLLVIYWGVMSVMSAGYLYQQYIWQKASVWIQSGAYDINFTSFARMPLIIFDNFIPITAISIYLSNTTAILLWTISIIFIGFILYHFRKLKLIWLGFGWMIITILPFIFFKTQLWWEPLASRYNYLPRFGAVLILAVILHHLITQNKSRHIISGMINLVIIVTAVQLYFMYSAISTQYSFVYATGRTLASAMEQIKEINPQKLYIAYDHPFITNNAHIVGAASVIANIGEGDLVFLQKGEVIKLYNGEVMLLWNKNLNSYQIQETQPSLDTLLPYQNLELSIQARVDDLLSRMTISEKIGQMALIEKNSIKDLNDIVKYGLGALMSGGGGYPADNTPQGWLNMVMSYQNYSLKTRLAIPMLYGVDANHGHSNLPGATVFPHSIGLGASKDADLVRQIGRATAQEVAATGINWIFSPDLDVARDVRWGRAYETFGADSKLVGELGQAYIEGLQSFNQDGLMVAATAKHFVGNGATVWGSSINKDYFIDQGNSNVSEAELRKVHLAPFKRAIDADVKAVMISLNTWNGQKISFNKYLITDVLKKELGFANIVVSDWYGIYEQEMNKYEALVKSINAGIDLVMLPFDYKEFTEEMSQAIANGDIAKSRIDDAVSQILKVKFELGLFDHPLIDSSNFKNIGLQENRELARKAVRQSLVLLKNNNALPLGKNISRILVAGSAANNLGQQMGGWTVEWQGIDGNWTPGTTILKGIQDIVSSETQVDYDLNGNFNNLVEKADIGIAVVGEKPYAEGYGDDENLKLSTEDLEAIANLKKNSKKLVVIIISGRPLDIKNYSKDWDAIIAAWLPGSEGQGVTDVLFGDYPFTGTSPLPWDITLTPLTLLTN